MLNLHSKAFDFVVEVNVVAFQPLQGFDFFGIVAEPISLLKTAEGS